MNNNHDDWFKKDSDTSKLPKASKPKRNKNWKLKFASWFAASKKGTSSFETENKKVSKLLLPFLYLITKMGHGILWLNDHALLKKIMYTILLIVLFRVAASITAPGIIIDNSKRFSDSSFLGIMNLMGGGTLARFSIVALGISPYITASIIMTLLQSEVFPPIYNLARSGPKGKRKINVITRCITLVFAVLQAITMLQQLTSNSGGFISLRDEFNLPLFKFFVLPAILIAGSMFTLFLGEQITNKGVGNGTSLIIFSGIAARLPSTFKNAWIQLVGSSLNSSAFVGVMNFIVYTASFLLLLFIILYIYKSLREIPIQQTGAGMTRDAKQMSRLPIKLNPGGVMPIIFGLMIMSIPLQVVQFMDHQNDVRIWIQTHLRFTDWPGLIIMCVLVFIFAIAMGFVTFNPVTIADNFKKNGTFVPGVRPGQETEDYLSSVVLRLGVFSGFYLAAISSIKYLEQIIGLQQNIAFGGTTVIILVSVAVETINQITARETTHKMTRRRVNSLGSGAGTGGLLW